MSKNVHVPKFGNWESGGVAYTAYFENARKEKGAGSKIFNPNDPEENPDAFMSTTFTQEHEYRKQHQTDYSIDSGIVNAVYASPGRSMHSVKQHHNKNHSREDSGFHGCVEAPAPHISGRVNLDPQGSRIHSSEPSSDKNSTDSLFPPSHHHRRSSKCSAEGGYGFSPSPTRQAILRAGNAGQVEAQHRRVPSVPKFGDWDETDPKSAEGFTVIFEKVKEEKKIAAANLPAVPIEPMNYPDRQRNCCNASSRSKIACCLFPAADE